MSYQGQIVFQFDTERDDELLKERADQIGKFSTFLFIFFTIVILLALLLQSQQYSIEDYIILFGVLVLLTVIYYRIRNRMEDWKSQELTLFDERLIVYEYGIEFPPLTDIAIDPLSDDYNESSHQYISYNAIQSIQITQDEINFQTEQTEYKIDLSYFPFIHEKYEQDGLVDFFIELIQKIKKNLDKVENRDHPTIIPKAYFRDILPE